MMKFASWLAWCRVYSVSTQGSTIEKVVSSGLFSRHDITSVTAGDIWSLLAAELQRSITELGAHKRPLEHA